MQRTPSQPQNEEVKTYGLSWKKIADGWARLGEGNHPSAHIVRAYERFLLESAATAEKPKILLLGATPELRDMFAAHPKLEVTLLDLNAEMIDAMTSLMKTAGHVNEQRVVGNWIEPPFEDGSFHAVLGDQIGNNVPFAHHQTLYGHIARLLAPGGSYITRITSRFPDTSLRDPEKLIAHFGKIPPTKESISEFWNLATFFTHGESITASDRVLMLLEKQLANPILKGYYEHFSEILPRGKSWYIGHWEEERTKILQYFEIINLARDDTFFSDSTYVFHFRPKQIVG